jgi:ubiquinone/menaquinone biosynthesis C-methylase UbiE
VTLAAVPRADYEGWMADAYDAGRRLGPEAFSAWREAAGRYLGPGPAAEGGAVLDLGAGTGRFSGHLAEWSGALVAAVEPTEAMAARARAKHQPGVQVVRARAESLPLAGGSVRAVWLSQVIHHIDDLPAAARELARVVRPGGHLLLRGELRDAHGRPESGVTLEIYRYFPEADRVAQTFPGREQVLATLSTTGFELIRLAAVEQTVAGSLQEFHDRLATRADSTLAAMDDEAFAAGLARLARDAAAEVPPRPVIDRLGFAVLERVVSG